MQSIKAGMNEDGQRLDRILTRFLPGAGKGLIYKLLRKKTIVVNGSRAEGDLRLKAGDEIRLYLADETFEKLRVHAGACTALGELAAPDRAEALSFAPHGAKERADRVNTRKIGSESSAFNFREHIVYEDEDVILVNKPAGILSQKAEPSDVSLNEYLIDYLMEEGVVTESTLATFRPGVCNRLDRNTSGIVAAGRSYRGLKLLSAMFKDRTIGKYYLCIVKGKVSAAVHVSGYLSKDERTNKVVVTDRPAAGEEDAYDRIETEYRPLKYGEGCTLLEVKLITGKTHQIRAHLAHEGHPVAGDPKYGDVMFNRTVRDAHRVKSQLLCAYRLVFPSDAELPGLAGREVRIAPPEAFFIKP